MSSLAISQPRAALGPLAACALPVAVVAVGRADDRGGPDHSLPRGRYALGTPLPPFLMSWTPDVHWPAVDRARRWRSGVPGAAPWAIERVRSGTAFATLSYVVTLAVGLSVRAARLGTAGWTHVFDLRSGRIV